MGFVDAVKSFFKKYVVFSGRASRSEYWYAMLFSLAVVDVGTILARLILGHMSGWQNGFELIVGLPVVVFLDVSGMAEHLLLGMLENPFPDTVSGWLNALVLLATFLPTVSLTVRRLHDVNRSGWYCWLCFVPVVGWFILIRWFCIKGTAVNNRFGSDPLAGVVPEPLVSASNFKESIVAGFSNYARFSGRARRLEYWYWVLFVFLGAVVCMIVDLVLIGFSGMQTDGMLSNLFSLITWFPGIAIGVRRLHDVNRSGWYMCWPFAALPVFGIAALVGMLSKNVGVMVGILGSLAVAVLAVTLLIWFCRKGTTGDNRFGPDPLAAALAS
jgi:uncharacterized membrane protein YhaH (DUF805 family)